MKKIHKYVADDGTEFKTGAACFEYESLCAEIDEIMEKLPNRPENDGCRFSNGHGYLQHSHDLFWSARDALLRIGNRLMHHEWFDLAIADRTAHPSWCGRLIYDMNKPALDRAWFRIMCVDKDLREWGQPYYADNQNKVQRKNMVQLNSG